jgi:transposase
MEITAAQYPRIEDCLPRQRGNVSLSNLQVLKAILYVSEHGCKWRVLPERRDVSGAAEKLLAALRAV